MKIRLSVFCTALSSFVSIPVCSLYCNSDHQTTTQKAELLYTVYKVSVLYAKEANQTRSTDWYMSYATPPLTTTVRRHIAGYSMYAGIIAGYSMYASAPYHAHTYVVYSITLCTASCTDPILIVQGSKKPSWQSEHGCEHACCQNH